MKLLMIIAALSFSLCASAQTNHAKPLDPEAEASAAAHKTDTIAKPAATVISQHWVRVWTTDELSYLCKVIRSSAKLTANQAEDYIQALTDDFKPISDSTKKK